MSSWLQRRRGAVASVGVLAAAALTIGTLAFAAEGEPAANVDLNDGGVWITKTSALLVGHVNRTAALVDGGVRTTQEQFDVLQSAETVLSVSAADFTVVDPVTFTIGQLVSIPDDAEVLLGGDTVAVHDTRNGNVWVLRDEDASAFSAATDPTIELGPGGAVTVGRDGVVHAASREYGRLFQATPAAPGASVRPESRALEGVPEDAKLAITSVGDTAVMLDRRSGRLFTADDTIGEVEGGPTAQLQIPSDANDAVLVATDDALVTAQLDGTGEDSRPATKGGVPAAPVWMTGCAYAVWNGTLEFVRDCVGEESDLAMAVPGADAESELRFRVNRDAVMLNDVASGVAWIADGEMQRVENWNDVTPPDSDSETEENSTEESQESIAAERRETNTQPVANDDEYGVRPGRTTLLPVLENDSDADGDVLVATVEGGDPTIGTVTPVQDGAALQIDVPADAAGTSTFTYRVDDGRTGTDTGRVTLTVRPEEVNAEPEPTGRTTVIPVEVGASVTYNLLPDWRDPDGDDIFLQTATAADGNEVTFTPDGRVTFRAVGGATGRSEVAVVVSDGRLAGSGTLVFDVRGKGTTTPFTNADHVVVRAGQAVTVSPLANDTAGGTEPLRLAHVTGVPGAEVVPDFADKSFVFRSDTVGTVYVLYVATAGVASSQGVVRVDVMPPAADERPPVAVRDTALLPRGGDVLVGVLANDVDPGGGVLVVQSVDVPEDAGVSVAVIGNETLRIADTAGLSGQVRIKYTISNGTQAAIGDVIIIPVAPPAELLPPVVNEDSVIVRAGDVVTIPVLDNDASPTGSVLHVAPDLVDTPSTGTMFVSGDVVRYRASEETGTVNGVYEVIDEDGQRVSARITVTVMPVDEENNAAPLPRDVTARTIAGGTMNIAIPLDGIDPDGDSVEFVGLDSAPRKGIVGTIGSSWIAYEAQPDASGADAFTYRVRDRLGREATATIRVGIAPPLAVNQAPFATPDIIVAGAGRTVAVPVTLNDTDPDGDAITLLEEGLIVPDVEGLTAKVDGDDVVITTPEDPVRVALQYMIRDSRGARAVGVIDLTVDGDVPLVAPRPADDWVRLADLTDDGTVAIDVRGNDVDPDGTPDQLTVTVDDPGAELLPDGRVQVAVTDVRQLIGYTVTDVDGLTGTAYVFVPASADLRPTLLSAAGSVTVPSGETVLIALSDYVQTVPGRTAILTEALRVSALNSDGASLIADQETLRYTSADGYVGPDAITFEATDGDSPSDPEGRKATLTIPITVTPIANTPPTFTNSQITLGQGEPAQTVSLRSLTQDPDPGDLDAMAYAVVSAAPSGITVRLDGDSLTLAAAEDAAPGAGASITVRVTDGQAPPVEGTIAVTVRRSALPLAVTVDDVIDDAIAGQPRTVDVLRNDTNPFPGTPMELVGASVVSGFGDARVTGGLVEVTPAADFVGTMVVRYRVQDASGDPLRQVEGGLYVTVRGRPSQPSRPVVEAVQSQAVTLSWTAPAANGSPITGYTVQEVGGPATACGSTTCTITGLANGVDHTFTVTATNAIGVSDPSPPSGPARPDDRPDAPAPPIVTTGDGEAYLSWSEPTNSGSPVTGYSLEIVPNPGSGPNTRQTSDTSLTWTGLVNGTAYQFRVRAHNAAPTPSDFSGLSQAATPSGIPGAPGAPTVSTLDPVGSQAQMSVNWGAADANGAAISAYEVIAWRGGTEMQRISTTADARSQTFALDPSTTDYTFTVRAQNLRGWGGESAASSPRRAFTPPGAPSDVTLVPGDNRVNLSSWTAPPLNGANASEVGYEYSADGGAWAAIPADRVIPGMNGVPMTVRVRATVRVGDIAYSGPASPDSAPATPYGRPFAPRASVAVTGTSAIFSWSPQGENGRPIARADVQVDGGAWQQFPATGSHSASFAADSTHTFTVRLVDDLGAMSDTVTETAVIPPDDPPPPTDGPQTLSISKSGIGTDPNGTSGNIVQMSYANMTPGTYTISCMWADAPGGSFQVWDVFPIEIAANASQETPCVWSTQGTWVKVALDLGGGNVQTSNEFGW